MKKGRKANKARLSALLSLAFACSVSASTYGQTFKMTFNKSDCKLSEVIREIEKKDLSCPKSEI